MDSDSFESEEYYSDEQQEVPLDWSEYCDRIMAVLDKAGYEIAPPTDEPNLLRASRDWGEINASLIIDPEARLRFVMNRPTTQSWSEPIKTGAYTFVVSHLSSETLMVTRNLATDDFTGFETLLMELESIGHANWKNLDSLN